MQPAHCARTTYIKPQNPNSLLHYYPVSLCLNFARVLRTSYARTLRARLELNKEEKWWPTGPRNWRFPTRARTSTKLTENSSFPLRSCRRSKTSSKRYQFFNTPCAWPLSAFRFFNLEDYGSSLASFEVFMWRWKCDSAFGASKLHALNVTGVVLDYLFSGLGTWSINLLFMLCYICWLCCFRSMKRPATKFSR